MQDRELYAAYSESTAVTEYKTFSSRTHYTLGQDGWEDVADYALTWAENHARGRSTAAAN